MDKISNLELSSAVKCLEVDANKNIEMPEQDSKWSKKQIQRNLLMLSIASFLFDCSFDGLRQLQSTMNDREGTGVMSLAALYLTLCLSAIFFPDIIIQKIGLKKTIAASVCLGFPYILSNSFPIYEVLIPAAILRGICMSLHYTAKFSYINHLSSIGKNAKDQEFKGAWYFGIILSLAMTSSLFGNGISYFILTKDTDVLNNVTDFNCGTKFMKRSVLSINETNIKEVSETLRHSMVGVFCSLCIISILIALFLNDIRAKDDKASNRSIISNLVPVFQIFKKLDMILLLPLPLYYGIQESFYVADFSKAYVQCLWGMKHVSLVAMCRAFASLLFSLMFGKLQKFVGRIPIFSAAAIASVIILAILFFWNPTPNQYFVFFIIASLWGILKAVYLSQVFALFGMIFLKQDILAYGVHFMATGFAQFLPYILSNYINISTKLYILSFSFILAQVGYVLFECNIRGILRKTK